MSLYENSFCERKKFLSQKEVSVTDRSFCHRKKFLSQKEHCHRKNNCFAFFVVNSDKQIYALSRNISKIRKLDNGRKLFCEALATALSLIRDSSVVRAPGTWHLAPGHPGVGGLNPPPVTLILTWFTFQNHQLSVHCRNV